MPLVSGHGVEHAVHIMKVPVLNVPVHLVLGHGHLKITKIWDGLYLTLLYIFWQYMDLMNMVQKHIFSPRLGYSET